MEYNVLISKYTTSHDNKANRALDSHHTSIASQTKPTKVLNVKQQNRAASPLLLPSKNQVMASRHHKTTSQDSTTTSDGG
jgi:hypothetical protein